MSTIIKITIKDFLEIRRPDGNIFYGKVWASTVFQMLMTGLLIDISRFVDSKSKIL